VDVPIATQVQGRPAPALRPYVREYVGFELRGFPAGVHQGPPTRDLTAVISLDRPFEMTGSDGSGRHDRFTAVAGGLISRSVQVHHGGEQHGIQVSLTPSGARAVYGMPAGELADQLVPLEVLLGPLAPELVERLPMQPTWSARFSVLDEVLLRAVRLHPDRVQRVRDEVAEAWRRLVAARGRVQVSALAADLGWSRRNLGERFRHELGLPPKTVARVLRFEHAHELATASVSRPWSEVAASAGYADQAHLVREWRDITGLSPTAWRRGEVLGDVG
jgi:AraC-like DNA-binding protein